MRQKSFMKFQPIIFCLVITIFLCLPFLNGQISIGPDTSFHLNRIEALSIAIRSGDFYPRVFFEQNFNFGYGSPMFYSFFFLYIPALLRILGVNLFYTYQIFLFGSCFFASLSMFYCASYFLKNKPVYSYITVMVYILNCFYMSDFYKRGAIGEVLAFIFIPITIVGIYHSLFDDKSKNRILLFGFCGLLLSHNISFVLMVILYGILILLNFKKLLSDKKRCFNIIINAITGFFLTCFFTLPLLQQMTGSRYSINGYFGTLSLSDYAMNFGSIFDFRTDASNYLCDSVGPFLLFIPLLYFFMNKSKRTQFMNFLILSSYLMIFMTTNLFPWKFFTLFSFLQFPTRLLIPASSFLALVVGYALLNFDVDETYRKIFNTILISMITIVSVIQLYGIYSTYGIITPITTSAEIKNDLQFLGYESWYNIQELSTPDYLPMNANIDYRYYGDQIKTNSISAFEIIDSSSYNSYTIKVNQLKKNDYFILPRTFYIGYVAEIKDGDKVVCILDAIGDPDSGLVTIQINEDYALQDPRLHIYYKGTSLQSLSGFISIFTLIFVLFSTKIKRENK